jgi:hypothetical protein
MKIQITFNEDYTDYEQDLPALGANSNRSAETSPPTPITYKKGETIDLVDIDVLDIKRFEQGADGLAFLFGRDLTRNRFVRLIKHGKNFTVRKPTH